MQPRSSLLFNNTKTIPAVCYEKGCVTKLQNLLSMAKNLIYSDRRLKLQITYYM